MTQPKPPERTAVTLVDSRAPDHARGAKRLLLAPGAVSLGDGTNGHAVVLLRLGRPDGSVVSLFRGTSLYGAVEVATGAIRDRRPDAVWITDRGYFATHFSPWTLRTVEGRLAGASDDADVPLLAWTGDGRDPGSGRVDDAGPSVGAESPAGVESAVGAGSSDGA